MAGAIVQSVHKIMRNHELMDKIVIALDCTADAADGSFPAHSIDPATYGIAGWYLYSVETNPGTVAPTAAYDAVINDDQGGDVAVGLLANRSASATEKAYPGTAGSHPIFDGPWSLVITNNSVNSATIKFLLTFVRE